MKRALISVSDKTGLVEFAKSLFALNFEIVSTGGTKKVLDEAGIKTIGIEEVTGFPEILDGRVKTLHPMVHGGLLARRDKPEHMETLKEHGIVPIDLVYVNLYPFKKTLESGKDHETIIENIDIGGPSMVRSAAKNYASVTVLTDPADFEEVLKELKENGDTTLETREKLAAKAFRTTAQYDTYISTYLTKRCGEEFPERLTLTYNLKQPLRYGENPHQKAALYESEKTSYSIVYGKQLQGKELSYNNIQDGDACLSLLQEFKDPTCIALKHMNPCGAASSNNIVDAFEKAYASDPVSIYGGILAVNRPMDEDLAQAILDKKVFLEIIMAPSYSEKARELLTKKKNCRIMEIDMSSPYTAKRMAVSMSGGLLYQDRDLEIFNESDLKVVTKKVPSEKEKEDLLFAWKCVKHVKSNAILVAKDLTIAGVGAGQMNRVGSAKIALDWAKEHGIKEMVLASDAFFPFDDTVALASQYGVTSIIQPGGSIRDEDSIKKCDELGLSMIFTGMRHFRH
ncbi:MAG: bifunctional phosphoribosylaminoimidazolecarboxamide formyltransferase/IMP cyclohydrolase [Eubacteriales bacterium]|nr:bifunctional phosphoribosylaminoimidazolecarboxamide formyltransferase/IMP cyclohydrolase [Eubacteriales bacterium]